MFSEPLCGAIPAVSTGLDALERRFIAVNLGATPLDACAYRRGEQLPPVTTGAVMGNAVDHWIASNVEDETQGQMSIDRTTAREYKEEHGDFDEFTVERSVMAALDQYVDETVNQIANTFLPQLANDHLKLYQQTLAKLLVLTGGMACIPGLVDRAEKHLSDDLQHVVDVTALSDPGTAATRGAQRIAACVVETEAY